LKKTSELEPNYMPTLFVLGAVYIQQGQLDEAIEQFRRIIKIDNESYLSLGFMGHALALAGQRAEAESLLNTLQETSQRKYVSPFSMLMIHLALGHEERTFQLLEQLYEDRNDWLVWLKVSPELRPLRNHPRFRHMLELVGLDD
ncbi:MAG TPA: tetratricopeptide repeat protein, partial [Pyrinomonadaceae bacterium]|nr:tetratricopeptide repeat protein [Pyrinomonadaceae bacterium]